MPALEHFSSAIGALYAAAAEPERWPDALRKVADLTGSVDAVLNIIPLDGSEPRTLAGRTSEEQCRIFDRDYHLMCRRIAYAISHTGPEAHYDSLIATESEMNFDPVYDWLQTIGIRYYIAGNVRRDRQYLIATSLQRSPSKGHVQRNDIELFYLYRGHCRRALALADALGTLQQDRRFTMAALDAQSHAVFALTDRGHVVFANLAGERLLRENDALTVSEGKLSARHPSDQLAFARLIASAGNSLDQGGGGWLSLRRTSGDAPLALFATTLPTTDSLLPLTTASVLLAVHDPLSRTASVGDALRVAFGLTEAECRIAEGLAAGLTPAALAAAAHTSAQTVRSQIKAVFRKLDAHRQQDVTRIVLGLAGIAPHPPNGG